ncbi:MAG: hypothetical protein OEV42_05930 [Deltaproteobacteria bacterium]|nr:hypothetical protein [Deltaproteobacteria bacterium]
MKKELFWRSLIVVIVICISIYVISAKGLNKGLDLAGGTHFTIGVVLKDIPENEKQEAIEQTLAVYRNRIDEIGVSGTTVQRSGEDKIIVQVPGIS